MLTEIDIEVLIDDEIYCSLNLGENCEYNGIVLYRIVDQPFYLEV